MLYVCQHRLVQFSHRYAYCQFILVCRYSLSTGSFCLLRAPLGASKLDLLGRSPLFPALGDSFTAPLTIFSVSISVDSLSPTRRDTRGREDALILPRSYMLKLSGSQTMNVVYSLGTSDQIYQIIEYIMSSDLK